MDELEAVRRALDAGMRASDIENVVPIIVPREYLEDGEWSGPYGFLRSQQLGITWTVLHPDQAMVYVNHERARAWERDAVDWRGRARDNLQRFSERLWTHEKRDASGRLFLASMMHEDGLGSSRLLLRERLLAQVGGGYKIGLPDRSCAVIVPLAAGQENLQRAGALVREMFEGATTPMLGELLDPADLEPAS
jgi:hypothetical protein